MGSILNSSLGGNSPQRILKITTGSISVKDKSTLDLISVASLNGNTGGDLTVTNYPSCSSLCWEKETRLRFMTTEGFLPILIGNLLRNSNPDVVFSVRDRKYLFSRLSISDPPKGMFSKCGHLAYGWIEDFMLISKYKIQMH